jgi:hypothetical protein
MEKFLTAPAHIRPAHDTHIIYSHGVTARTARAACVWPAWAQRERGAVAGCGYGVASGKIAEAGAGRGEVGRSWFMWWR